MANHQDCNVIFVDTTAATYTGVRQIVGIKYIGNASGTAAIQHATSSGKTLWEASGSTNTFDDVEIFNIRDGIYVTVTNSAKIYIYVK